MLQVAAGRLAHLLAVHQQAALGVAVKEVQQRGVVGGPVAGALAQGFRAKAGGVLVAGLGEHAVGPVVHQDEGDGRVEVAPVVEQVNGLGVGPAPKGLFQVAQHQVKRHAVPHRAGFNLLNLVVGFKLAQRRGAVHFAQRGADLAGHVAFAPRGLRRGHAAGVEQGFNFLVARQRMTNDDDLVHDFKG